MKQVKIDNDLKIRSIRPIDPETGDCYKDDRFEVICNKHHRPMSPQARAVVLLVQRV